jgi:hypothetical protein
MGGMSRKPVFSKALFGLIVAGLLLPIMICLVLGLASLLAAMGDALGAAVLHYVALAGGIAWAVVLVAMIVLQAIRSLDQSDDADR